MFVPHNLMDRDPSRESVQGVRLQLKGKNSGGFAGEQSINAELKSRRRPRDAAESKHEAQYFGSSYESSMKLPLEALEPNLQNYQTSEHHVVDHGYNGSAAGIYINDETR